METERRYRNQVLGEFFDGENLSEERVGKLPRTKSAPSGYIPERKSMTTGTENTE